MNNEYKEFTKIFFKNIFKFKEIFKEELIIVTASDNFHFLYLNNLINNLNRKIYKKYFFKKLIIFNLGISNKNISKINHFDFIEIRNFKFDNYPDFFSKRIPDHGNKLGGFAWKPAILSECSKDYTGKIFWLDSASKINLKFFLARIFFFEKSFISFQSGGLIEDYLFPGLKADLNIADNSKLLKSPNLMGGVVGFDLNNDISKKILKNWEKVCLSENNIFPKGSSLDNHRHDQTLLSIVYFSNSSNSLPSKPKRYGIKIQNWPNKILFFFDERNDYRKSLLPKFYLKTTTSDKRCKIIILFNVENLIKIPIRLMLTKKILVFIENEDDLKNLKNYYFRNKFIHVYHNNKLKLKNSNKKLNINFEINNLENVIDEEYKLIYG